MTTTKRAPKITHAPDPNNAYTPTEPPTIDHPTLGPARIYFQMNHSDSLDHGHGHPEPDPHKHGYAVHIDLDHAVTIHGKTYSHVRGDAKRDYDGGYTVTYASTLYDTLTDSARAALKPIFQEIANEYIAANGGAEELERKTRNNIRRARAEKHEEDAAKHTAEARKYRDEIEPDTVERWDTEEQARQLDAYATSTRDLYPARQAIEKTAEVYRISDRLDNDIPRNELFKACREWYAAAVKGWHREVDEPGEPKTRFTYAAIQQAALELADYMRAEAELGNYEHHIDPETRALLTEGHRFRNQ
jgi:hypothetical protein